MVITSATSGEGKTTTCINVAKTFAQTGVKVLIVDADLRAPRVHKYLDIFKSEVYGMFYGIKCFVGVKAGA